MWTRKELKDKAKLNLNKNYWMVVLVTFIVMITSGGTSSFGGSFSSGFSNGLKSGSQQESTQEVDRWDDMEFASDDEEISDVMGEVKKEYNSTFDKRDGFILAGVGAVILIIVLIIFLVAFALSIFLFNPLKVGCYKWYIHNRKENPQLGIIGDGFTKNYMRTVEIMFCKSLFTILWSMLCLIPGIVKAYEYRMIPYIVAENPDITRQEAFQMSKTMMTGEKWNAFVLDLSFILWNIVAGLCCGIPGFFYVYPYIQLTNVELYVKLKETQLGIHDTANGEQGTQDPQPTIDNGYTEL